MAGAPLRYGRLSHVVVLHGQQRDDLAGEPDSELLGVLLLRAALECGRAGRRAGVCLPSMPTTGGRAGDAFGRTFIARGDVDRVTIGLALRLVVRRRGVDHRVRP